MNFIKPYAYASYFASMLCLPKIISSFRTCFKGEAGTKYCIEKKLKKKCTGSYIFLGWQTYWVRHIVRVSHNFQRRCIFRGNFFRGTHIFRRNIFFGETHFLGEINFKEQRNFSGESHFSGKTYFSGKTHFFEKSYISGKS